MCTNVYTHLDCGENVRTPHGIARVWPEPGKVPCPDGTWFWCSTSDLREDGSFNQFFFLEQIHSSTFVPHLQPPCRVICDYLYTFAYVFENSWRLPTQSIRPVRVSCAKSFSFLSSFSSENRPKITPMQENPFASSSLLARHGASYKNESTGKREFYRL